MKKAFFPRKLLCLRAVNLPIKRARGNITFRKLSPPRQEVRPLDLPKLAGNASVSIPRGQNNSCDRRLLQQHALLLFDRMMVTVIRVVQFGR